MKVIFLLGANFVRSQVLLLAILLGYIICLTAFLAFHEQLSDLLFFIRQQAIYAIALGGLVMVSALHNERKSRRVLNVLSKGIHRWQYLGGLLCGTILVAGMFCLAVGLSSIWLAREAFMPLLPLTELLLVLFLACMATTSTALFFSVFLHPLLALPATAIFLLLPFAAAFNAENWPQYVFPVFSALRVVLGFTLQKPVSGLWQIALASLIHASGFWLAASATFVRRDVTVAAE